NVGDRTDGSVAAASAPKLLDGRDILVAKRGPEDGSSARSAVLLAWCLAPNLHGNGSLLMGLGGGSATSVTTGNWPAAVRVLTKLLTGDLERLAWLAAVAITVWALAFHLGTIPDGCYHD